jgi:hypothetical protein
VESNLRNPVFDFASVTNNISQGAFSGNFLWYVFTLKIEKAVYLLPDIERMKSSGKLLKISKSPLNG